MERASTPAATDEVGIGILGDLVGYHLRRASTVIGNDFAVALDGTRIRQVLFAILSIVKHNPGINQGAVGRALGIQRANMGWHQHARGVAAIDLQRARAECIGDQALYMTDSNDDYVYDDATGEWISASAAAASVQDPDVIEVRDAVGNLLADGDSVTLIKDLAVKGANQTLKRGTVIKSIRLTGDAQEIDCRYEGIKGLVLRAEFVRKR